MKQSLLVVFVVYVLAIVGSVGLGLTMIWSDVEPSPLAARLLGSGALLILASLLYVAVAEAVIRNFPTSDKSPSRE